jgi:hypothetical protein
MKSDNQNSAGRRRFLQTTGIAAGAALGSLALPLTADPPTGVRGPPFAPGAPRRPRSERATTRRASIHAWVPLRRATSGHSNRRTA